MTAAPSRKITIKEIKDRCDEIGDCWIWKNSVGEYGYPIIRRNKQCLLVRRVVAEIKGTPPNPRQPVVTSCGDKRCCNPQHIELSTTKQVAKAAGKAGAFSQIDRCAKIAKSRRSLPSAKLTMEKAREIRTSDKSRKELAEEFGISLSLVKAVRAGTTWKEYSSPFAGLGARINKC